MKDFKLDELLTYHPNTGVFTWKITRGSNAMAGKLAGCVINGGYVMIGVGNQRILAHRLAWYFTYGVWPTKPLKHINGKRDDNRIENLKEASRSELSTDSNSGRKNPTGLKGVTYRKDNDRYIAQIVHNRVVMYIGSYKTKTEAHVAYQTEAAKLKAESK